MIVNRTAWNRAATDRKHQAAQAGEPCCLCGKPIDYTRGYWIQRNGRRTVNQWAVTVEHHDHRALGGDELPTPDRLGVAHAYCQQVQGQWLRRVVKARTLGLPAPPKPTYHGPKGRPPRAAIITTKPKRETDNVAGVFSESPPARLRRSFVPSPGKGSGSLPYAAGWLGEPPGSWRPPRLETPVPSHVVGSLAQEALPAMEQRLGRPLRYWQRYVITRRLEVDGDGRLVWRFVLDSAARQQGKSWGIRELALWRPSQVERFGESQSVLHIAKDLGLARRIMAHAWRWAERHGLETRKVNGQESILWPDGESGWLIRSQDAAYGWTGSAAEVDEAWAIPPEVVWEGLYPTLVERDQSQLALHSAAHRRATRLVPSVLPGWLSGKGLVLLWGADPGADFEDPATWQASQPHWTPARRDAMAAAGPSSPGFAEQWLNVWPELEEAGGWVGPEQWAGLRVGAFPAGPVTVAVESALDGSGYGVARAVTVDGRVTVEAVHVGRIADMRQRVVSWRGSGGQVVCGASVAGFMSPEWDAQPVTQSSYAAATAQFVDALRGGQLGHLPGADLDDQVPAMTLKGTGKGAVLTGSGVHVARSAVWAVWAALSRKLSAFIA